MNTNKKPEITCLYCVGDRDINYLFELSLSTSIKYISFIYKYVIVTPSPQKIKRLLNNVSIPLNIRINVIHEDEFLDESEKLICGWSKQQILKLKSDLICQSENIISIGADTIIVNPIKLHDLYHKQDEILRFRTHKDINPHFLFEEKRSKNVRKILRSKITLTKETDFIFDIFLFKKKSLIKLRNYIKQIYGENYFQYIFPREVLNFGDMEQIGEWTLHSIFVIEICKAKYQLRSGNNFVCQIHSHKMLKHFKSTERAVKAIHFVRKDFSKDEIVQNLQDLYL